MIFLFSYRMFFFSLFVPVRMCSGLVHCLDENRMELRHTLQWEQFHVSFYDFYWISLYLLLVFMQRFHLLRFLVLSDSVFIHVLNVFVSHHSLPW